MSRIFRQGSTSKPRKIQTMPTARRTLEPGALSGGAKSFRSRRLNKRRVDCRGFYHRLLAKLYTHSGKLNGGEGLGISDFVAALKGAADVVKHQCFLRVQRIRQNHQTHMVGMVHVQISAKREYRRLGVSPRYNLRDTVENLLSLLRNLAAQFAPQTA